MQRTQKRKEFHKLDDNLSDYGEELTVYIKELSKELYTDNIVFLCRFYKKPKKRKVDWKPEEIKKDNLHQMMPHSVIRNEEQNVNLSHVQAQTSVSLASFGVNKFVEREEVKTRRPGVRISEVKKTSPMKKREPFEQPMFKKMVKQKTFRGLNIKKNEQFLGKLSLTEISKVAENDRNISPNNKNRIKVAKNSLMKNHAKFKEIKEKLKKTPIAHYNEKNVQVKEKFKNLPINFVQNEAKEESKEIFRKNTNNNPFSISLTSAKDNSNKNKEDITLQKKGVFNKTLVILIKKYQTNRTEKKS